MSIKETGNKENTPSPVPQKNGSGNPLDQSIYAISVRCLKSVCDPLNVDPRRRYELYAYYVAFDALLEEHRMLALTFLTKYQDK